ncbi:uncharacterized protein LOC141588637 [Silene latifolia]|uniref:uncharacterized protein LOC141588637 n=1 Tax=Silene latifolia TaxID=37657 RepID=UPI003D77EA49
MEILSRMLRVIHRQQQVTYHPKCGKLGLNQLIFADDLMIFVRGDVPSVKAVTDSLQTFASMSGLKANPEKTNIYMGGIREEVKQTILSNTGFIEGYFPFRYLGVPINEGRLNKTMFADLLNKIQKAMSYWATHMLSYAGKITLINTVIFGLEQYWCATLLIPKGVMKIITKFCRQFLWQSEEGARKLIMKSWTSCCYPHNEGGFNIKEILAWNKCILCKWIWAIDSSSSSTWTQWNMVYNIKAHNFWDMQIQPQHSESWRSILYVRDELVSKSGGVALAQSFLNSCVKAGKLKLRLLYDIFREKGVKQPWTRGVWHRAVLPKHSFILVLAMQRKLATIDSLSKKGFCLVNRCILCKQQSETHRHLFFQCHFAAEIWSNVLAWLKLYNRTMDVGKELRWLAGRRVRKHWKSSWIASCLGATVYCIWEERNARIFKDIERTVEYVTKRIQFFVSTRLLFVTHPSYEDEITRILGSVV